VELITPSLTIRKPKLTGGLLAGLAATIALLAVILAFILDPVVGLFMRMKMPRGLASFFTCSVALLIVYFSAVAFYTQAAGLIADLPTYSQRITELVDSVVSRLENTERTISDIVIPKRLQRGAKTAQIVSSTPTPPAATKRRSAEPPAAPTVQEVRLHQESEPIVDRIYAYLTSFYDVLLMASFVPFLVYFMLSWRDHLRRSFLQLFEGPDRMVAGKSWEGIADMARAYVVGNFILGVLLSVASSLVFFAAGLPFPLLIGPVSAFLSLIPYVGMPLALIPPFFAALPLHSKIGFYLVIGSTVAFFHLLALNLLYPKLVGARVHLNPLAVTISLMFWATLWGAAGLVIGIPITAGVKAVCDNVKELDPYGKLLGD
jgi:predicted PurR-regulated permease PerM